MVLQLLVNIWTGSQSLDTSIVFKVYGHLSSRFSLDSLHLMGVKESCPSVLQNTVRDTKRPGVSKP